MRIVKIKKSNNGGHLNQKKEGVFKIIPEGWAVIPDGIETKNFPFGEVEVDEINGVMTVIKWTPGNIPKIEETEESENPISKLEQLRADIDYLALMTEVDL